LEESPEYNQIIFIGVTKMNENNNKSIIIQNAATATTTAATSEEKLLKSGWLLKWTNYLKG
jgi:uncharacterized protein YjlB